MSNNTKNKDSDTRMGNPRTVPLRPDDLTKEETLKKYIYPRILDIALQTELDEDQFDELMAKFKLYWKEEKTKKLNDASKNIKDLLSELNSEEKETVMKLLGLTPVERKQYEE